MIKDAIEYLVELTQPNMFKSHGKTYATAELQDLPGPEP
jgi:hypothetical protein